MFTAEKSLVRCILLSPLKLFILDKLNWHYHNYKCDCCLIALTTISSFKVSAAEVNNVPFRPFIREQDAGWLSSYNGKFEKKTYTATQMPALMSFAGSCWQSWGTGSAHNAWLSSEIHNILLRQTACLWSLQWNSAVVFAGKGWRHVVNSAPVGVGCVIT